MSGSRTKSLVYALFLLCGVCLLAAPVAMDAYSSWRAQQVITTLEDKLDESNDPVRLAQLEQATAYNRMRAGLPYTEPDGGLWGYDDQLSWKGKPYMAYLHAPVAHIKTPIYHGTEDAELAAGIGHLEGRSLPVGGETSLCVLEGHSGMATSRMFDDIRLLEEGDMFCIWSLAEPYAYRVEEWKIVDPSEVPDELAYKDGEDIVVLVTCTTDPDFMHPKGAVGINDRRLLVFAERCPYDPDYFAQSSPVIDTVTSPRSWPFVLVIVCLSVLALVSVCAKMRSRRMRRRHVEVPLSEES